MTTSVEPSASSAANKLSTSALLVASQANVLALVSRAKSASLSMDRAASATFIPACANARASEADNPEPAPTIRADVYFMPQPYGRRHIAQGDEKTRNAVNGRPWYFLHSKNPEFRLRHRCIQRCGKCQRQHAPRLGRRNDAVVPQPRCCIIGITLGLELFAQRLLEFFFIGFRPVAAAGLDIVTLYGRQDTRSLFAPHHRNA